MTSKRLNHGLNDNRKNSSSSRNSEKKCQWTRITLNHKKLLETSSQELLADNKEPGGINVEIHNEQPTGDDKKIKHDEKPVFKKVIETENTIIEITRNFGKE